MIFRRIRDMQTSKDYMNKQFKRVDEDIIKKKKKKDEKKKKPEPKKEY